jgi:MHS family citrate/tricarballylate:H+ symporter-like MFS transporter
MTITAPQGEASRPRIALRHVMAVFVGNGLEFYDFLTFSYFAVYISRTFFPSGNPSAALLATLATFGAGFLTRPVGAIVIGGMGDRVGRKPAMLLSFTLMGFAIIGLALTPSYARIGPLAPALVLFFRLVQGFALGGEVGPTTAYMAEAAPPHRRGLYLSMQYATQDAAVLAAGLVGTTLAAHLTADQLQQWGWRAAMLLGASLVPFGLFVRHTLPETLGSARDEGRAPGAAAIPREPALARVRPYLPIIVFGLMMLTAGTIGSYTLSYMTTYALDTLHLPATISFTLIIINGGCSMVFEALSGWLSDRFGRKPVMIVPGILLILSILPCFWVIGHLRNVWAVYGAEAVMSIFASISAVPVIVTITETLPAHIRSGAVATIYAFAISIFGGSTQFLLKLLIDRTGNPLAPAWYWTCAALIGLTAMILVRESAPGRKRPAGATPAAEAVPA